MPTMLPCTHIFCSQCIPLLAKNECPSCNSQFLHQDTRPASHLKSLVQIFKEMNFVVATTFPHQKSEEAADTVMVTKGSPVSGNNCVMDTPNDQLSELQMHASKSLSQREGESNGSAMQKSKKRLRRLCKELDSENGELVTPSSFGTCKDTDGYNSDCSKRQPGSGMLKKQKMSMESRHGVKDVVGAAVLENCEKSSHGISLLGTTDSLSAVKIFKCMFCHSKENTEGSGPLFHFVDGKDVGLAGATHPNAFHVHEKCYQWSPQIYYVNETLVNLDVELARASKIKCSKCNVKGAALGCYVKTCRRSYHVPCAYYMHDVRWDCENFLMLCPYHSSKKLLPCDKSNSKSKKRDNRLLDSSDLPDQTSTPWNEDWVFCASALSNKERLLLEKFACTSGATILYYWDSTVSHVIASVNDSGGFKRTAKVLMSILTGKWIVSVEWVKACLEAGKPVPEEQYEVTHDVHGCFNGPKTGRLRALQKEPKLFDGLNFYISEDFHDPSYRKNFVDLVLIGGGNVVTLDDLSHKKQVNEKATPSKPLILYSSEVLPEDCCELMKQRVEKAEALAADVGGVAISHSKFLDNVAACEFLVI